MKPVPLPRARPAPGLLPPAFEIPRAGHPPGRPARSATHATLLIRVGGALVGCAIERYPVVSPGEVRRRGGTGHRVPGPSMAGQAGTGRLAARDSETRHSGTRHSATGHSGTGHSATDDSVTGRPVTGQAATGPQVSGLPVDVAVYPRPDPPGSARPRCPPGTCPLVTVDILLPETRIAALGRRRALLEAGIREVWHVDAEARAVIVHTLAGSERHTGHRPVRSAALPLAHLVPEALFAPPTADGR
jgi:hypothetical protein